MLFNIIALQNENKLLKEKNKEQQKQIEFKTKCNYKNKIGYFIYGRFKI